MLASLHARNGRMEDALAALEQAVAVGFPAGKLIPEDPAFAPLEKNERFQALLAATPSDKKAAARFSKPTDALPLAGGRAPVTAKNTYWDPRLGMLRTVFRQADKSGFPHEVRTDGSPVAQTLNTWFAEGRAAGNIGDLYDNRDRGHSTLSQKDFPQLSFLSHDPAIQQRNMDYGLNTSILFNAPTIGNSSTAVTGGSVWRSLPRLAYTTEGIPRLLNIQYLANHLYIYPAVQDYSRKYGDILTANTPYLLATEGKSGSDLPFLKAIVSILAAFQPAEKQELIRTARLIPAVQMIFRLGQRTVVGEQDYLTGKAHPPVFQAANLDVMKMILLANRLKARDVPHAVQLEVLSENRPAPGIDGFTTDLTEKLFDSHAAIGRVIRYTDRDKTLHVTARSPALPGGDAPYRYRWVVLQGNPNLIRITPEGEAGQSARITVSWQDSIRPASGPLDRSNRVDIGVFADNGKHISAPSFITFLYPPEQTRRYDESGNLVWLDHTEKGQAGAYADPRLFPRRNWQDRYRYDDQGRLLGWDRTTGGQTAAYTRFGTIVTEKDAAGRPTRSEKIGYLYTPGQGGRMNVQIKRLGEFVRHTYDSASDQLGTLVR